MFDLPVFRKIADTPCGDICCQKRRNCHQHLLLELQSYSHSLLYANKLSKSIITAKPPINPKVAFLPNPFRWLSGTISSITTKSMAPAAKANPQGKIECVKDTKAAPRSPRLAQQAPLKSHTKVIFPYYNFPSRGVKPQPSLQEHSAVQ